MSLLHRKVLPRPGRPTCVGAAVQESIHYAAHEMGSVPCCRSARLKRNPANPTNPALFETTRHDDDELGLLHARAQLGVL